MTAEAALVPWALAGMRQTPPVALAARLVVGVDREQAGELALRAGVGLERHGVVAGDLAQPRRQVVDEGADALGLLAGANGWRLANSGQVTASISVVALSFIVHEPSGIMPRSSAKSRSESRRR